VPHSWTFRNWVDVVAYREELRPRDVAGRARDRFGWLSRPRGYAPLMRIFELHRDVDATGMSGTGRVVQGVEFDDGTVALRWLTELTSTAVYGCIEDVVSIHGHNGQTRLVWRGEVS